MKKILLIAALGVSLFSAEIIEKASCVGVDATTQNIKNILQKKGLTLFSIVDHSLNAKEAEMELEPSKLIIFGNAKVGTHFMQDDPRAGLDLPLKILVFQSSDGKVKMAYRDATTLQERHNIDAKEKVAKVNAALEKITTEASQCQKD